MSRGNSGKNGSGSRVTRRDFVRLAAAAATAGPLLRFPSGVFGEPARQRTLRIAKWAHFLPEYDHWFDDAVARQWGERHDTQVIVDHLPVEEIGARAAAEAAAGKGHDVFMFPWPPAEHARHAIDHTEIYQAVAARWGNVDRLGHRSTFDPRTKQYFAFADSWMPAPVHYLQDAWAAVGMALGPLHYGSLRSGGRRLRDKLGIPCGLALAPSLESNVNLHILLHGFGSRVLDEHGEVILGRGARAVAALKFVKALQDEAGAPEQLAWGPGDSVRAMVARKSSCTINAISLLRTAEKADPAAAAKIRLSPPLLGSAGVLSVPHVTNCSMVWKFAENPAGAKQFVGDLIDSSRAAYEQSQGCNFPIFQKTLPDLIVRLENDPHGDPPYKYKELKDALHWTANLGFPGYANPVAMEVFNTHVIPRMFVSVVKGEAAPEDAVHAADAEVKRIAEKWQQA